MLVNATRRTETSKSGIPYRNQNPPRSSGCRSLAMRSFSTLAMPKQPGTISFNSTPQSSASAPQAVLLNMKATRGHSGLRGSKDPSQWRWGPNSPGTPRGLDALIRRPRNAFRPLGAEKYDRHRFTAATRETVDSVISPGAQTSLGGHFEDAMNAED